MSNANSAHAFRDLHQSGLLIWNWPPEPLRWAACQLLTAGLRIGDALVDRQIRPFRGAG